VVRTLLVSASAALLLGCSSDGRVMRAPTFDQNESIITTTTAPEEPVGFDTASLPGSGEENLEVSIPWSEGDRIPVQFTCKGSNVSPSVAWFDVSPEAVGIAIVMYEIGVDQTIHWIVANLDPARAFIESGELGTPDVPAGVVVGLNDQSSVPGPTQGYRGPCPAPGTASTYTLEVHALGQIVELPSGTPAQDLRSAIDLVSIQRAAITAYAEG
jgi:Raf kinase inhibitor-like YbhB/YbcL family protein